MKSDVFMLTNFAQSDHRLTPEDLSPLNTSSLERRKNNNSRTDTQKLSERIEFFLKRWPLSCKILIGLQSDLFEKCQPWDLKLLIIKRKVWIKVDERTSYSESHLKIKTFWSDFRTKTQIIMWASGKMSFRKENIFWRTSASIPTECLPIKSGETTLRQIFHMIMGIDQAFCLQEKTRGESYLKLLFDKQKL